MGIHTMAGPLNGIGGQQNIPIANTYQPGNSNDIRRQDDSAPRENTVQPRGVAASETQRTQTEDRNAGVEIRNSGDSQQRQSYASQQRGSVIDITV
jgi:hypothetical protein